jgi:hypothetical protein
MQVDELLAEARDRTGLDDFGDDDYREGLEVLVRSFDDEADLNEMGRAGAAGQIVGTLSARLKIEDWYRSHPEIDDQEITSPLFVLGLPRTGSTVMGAILGEDPAVRALRTWEAGSPIPPPESATEHTDPPIAASQAGLDAMYEIIPALRAMNPGSATAPTECLSVLGFAFRSGIFEATAKIPSYSEWLIDCDMEPAYLYHRRVLKLLQWHCPPTRWRLRTPAHLYAIDALDRVYPDARFVMTHRDVASVIPSVASLMTTLASRASDRPDAFYFGEHCTDRWETALRRGINFRDAGREDRFIDFGFREMQTDPIDAVRRLYAWLGEDFSAEAEARMTQWRVDNAREKQAAHHYTPAEFGLDADDLRKRFSFYTDRFDVPLDG